MAPTRYESKAVDASALGKPLHFAFADRTAPNRFLKGAMTERLSSWSPTDLAARGIPSDELVNVYKRWGEGGFGVVLSGNIMIFPDHLEAAGNPIIPADSPFSGERFEAFKRVISATQAHGSLYVGQVSHPGRQCEVRINSDPVSASDVQLVGSSMPMEFAKPHPASEQEIQAIINGFAHAAQYLEKAGADGIQLHGAHGYLIAQFLSATTNKRTDAYGGSVANRARLIVEIAQEIRKRTSPGFIVGIKMNSVEFQKDGITPEEAKELVQILERERFDFVELSGGTYEKLAFQHQRDSTVARESFFMEFADLIVPALKQTKAYVTGGFRTVGAMADAMKIIDGIGLARPVTQEFDLPKIILEGKVQGSIKPVFSEDDFGMGNIVAGAQIRQVGKDQTPFDASDATAIEGFKKDVGAWMAGMKEDAGFEKYGFADLYSLPVIPYGATPEKAA